MKIGFVGLWHLGTVMSAVFAGAGHDVVAVDEADVVERLERLDVPVAEPGLKELIATETATGRLRFTAEASELGRCEIVWIAYDTPVRDDGSADVAYVISRICELFEFLRPGTLVVVSSQLPVGSVARLEGEAALRNGSLGLRFASSPENLRLGKSIAYLRDVDRFVVGVRNAVDETAVRLAFAPLSRNVEVMSVESAEMTKHALNAFLATSVTFINELSGLCERTGADAREVERGLKSDVRIGKLAYVRPGGPYAGGTLARDVAFVIDAEREHGLEPLLFEGVRAANDYHGSWLQRRFVAAVGDPRGRTMALLGLVYKPGTDTLRSSNAVTFARWFDERGGRIVAFDPALAALPPEVAAFIDLRGCVEEAVDGADGVYLATEWPEFRDIKADTLAANLRSPNVFDPGRFLSEAIQTDVRLRYYAIGVGRRVGA